MSDKEAKEPSEKELLTKEKIKLAKSLGIWQKFEPVENYQATDQHKRIKEIDKRLAEIG